MRGFLLCSVLLTGVPLGLFGSVDDQLMAMVPAGAKVVASVDATRARESAFGQYLLNRMNKDDSNLEQLVAATGFDPRRDLQHLVFANAGSNGEEKLIEFAVLARGIFDADQIKAAAKAKGAVIRKYHGLDVLVNKQGDERATGLVFPLADIAVFGDLKTVHAILDNSGAPSSLDPELQSLIKSAGTNNDAWFASLAGADSFGSHFLPPDQQNQGQAKAIQSIRQCSGGMRFGDAIDVTFDASTRSAQDATSLADVLRFGASMVQMQRGKDPRAAILAGALDQMNLRATGDHLSLSFSLPEKSLEQMAELHPHHQAQ